MDPHDSKSLQETYAPNNHCFGCGPANEKGLRIRSFVAGEWPDAETVCEWSAQRHHEAFDGMVNGGILGSLLDCHSNWTAAWYLMSRDKQDSPPCTVTAEFSVRLRRPTPSDRALQLRARVIEADGPKVLVEATVSADDEITATCRGTFVAVKPGHPAYHRW